MEVKSDSDDTLPEIGHESSHSSESSSEEVNLETSPINPSQYELMRFQHDLSKKI